VPLGVLSPERAELVQASLPGCTRHALHGAPRLHWNAAHLPTAERSTLLQHALQSWHQHGEVHGWRGESFAFWTHDTDLPPTDTPPLLQVERAGFRFLGMPSHAVHINGFTPQGLLWCGRRALSKATDPGMLDNVTAGGLPAGESPRDCALRELQEEAGATLNHAAQLASAGTIRTARQDTGGWEQRALPDTAPGVPQEGVAAAFGGLCGGMPVLAGGTHFIGASANYAQQQLHAHAGLAKSWRRELYGFAGGQWRLLGLLPAARAHGLSFQVGNSLLLVGGDTDGGAATLETLAITLSNGPGHDTVSYPA